MVVLGHCQLNKFRELVLSNEVEQERYHEEALEIGRSDGDRADES